MDDWSFSYSRPTPPDGTPLSAAEAERILLARLETSQDTSAALWELARFYSLVGRQDVAMTYVERVAERGEGPEDQAACYLAMGQLLEQRHDYEGALTAYRGAFRLEPADNATWYLINNNLGYCLNHFGRFEEAERLCRAATRIDPRRHNAFKNLGTSLAGLTRYAEAAECFVQAVRNNASDQRALHHLEDLIRAQGAALMAQLPDLEEQLELCRHAVQVAARARPRARAANEGEEA